jgi:hypothetical protein
MNSNSKCYDDYDPCKKEKGYNEYDSCSKREKEREREKEKEREREKEKKVCPTIIKCGAPGAVTIPTATIVGTTFTPASLTLNTCGICNPCSKIEVTSNIIATAFTGTITFQVLKQCRNQFTPVPVGPSFTFSELVAITESSTFTFFICDCDSCDQDCCTYTLNVTVNAVTVGILAINNVTLGAITTCGQSHCCN